MKKLILWMTAVYLLVFAAGIGVSFGISAHRVITEFEDYQTEKMADNNISELTLPDDFMELSINLLSSPYASNLYATKNGKTVFKLKQGDFFYYDGEKYGKGEARYRGERQAAEQGASSIPVLVKEQTAAHSGYTIHLVSAVNVWETVLHDTYFLLLLKFECIIMTAVFLAVIFYLFRFRKEQQELEDSREFLTGEFADHLNPDAFDVSDLQKSYRTAQETNRIIIRFLKYSKIRQTRVRLSKDSLLELIRQETEKQEDLLDLFEVTPVFTDASSSNMRMNREWMGTVIHTILSYAVPNMEEESYLFVSCRRRGRVEIVCEHHLAAEESASWDKYFFSDTGSFAAKLDTRICEEMLKKMRCRLQASVQNGSLIYEFCF